MVCIVSTVITYQAAVQLSDFVHTERLDKIEIIFSLSVFTKTGNLSAPDM